MKTPCRLLSFCVAAIFSTLFLSSALAQSKVRITSVTLSTRVVGITNFDSTAVDVSGWWFCNQFIYQTLGGAIAPGETRQFAVNTLNQNGSDLGLYNSPDFGNPAAMQDFLQWGSGFNGRESVAVAKKIWTTGHFLALPPTGKTLHCRGLSETGLRDNNWFAGWPSATFPVPDITFESATVTGGEWRIIAVSPYLTSAHRVDAGSAFGNALVEVAAPTITELGNGRIDVRFPATGARQFTRLRAEF
jgi:hypothetical protein